MPLTTNAIKQDLANAYGNAAAYASLHTGNPGSTGALEISGGSPAYARAPLVWTPGSGGTVTATATFNIPASTTVTYAGLWTAMSGGTFLDAGPLSNSATFATQSQYTLALTYLQT